MKTLAKWSVEDYHRLIDAGILASRRVELLAGEIIEMSPESPFHYSLTAEGSDYLKDLLKEKAYVRQNGPITLSDSEPCPDISIVQLPKQKYRDRHPNANDIFWLIEVSQSTLDYDLNEKKLVYAKAGIQEYWVIDVKATQIHIFRQPIGGNYSSQLTVKQGTISPVSFPNLEISIARLLNYK